MLIIDEEEFDLLCFLERFKKRKRFRITCDVPQSKKETHMLELTITNEQKVKVTITPVTATGKPAALDGAPSWSVSSGDSTISVAENGLSADLISSDAPGETMYVVSADADLGAGVENVTDSIKLVVEGAKAVNLGLVAGAPEAK